MFFRGRPARPALGSMFVFVEHEEKRRRQLRADDLARRLRRVRADIASCLAQDFLPGKRTRVAAGRLAYVDLLEEACDLLGIAHELRALAGLDRQLEVLRVEQALAGAGLDLQPA